MNKKSTKMRPKISPEKHLKNTKKKEKKNDVLKSVFLDRLGGGKGEAKSGLPGLTLAAAGLKLFARRAQKHVFLHVFK